MPVRSMTLTTNGSWVDRWVKFQMPVRSMTLTTPAGFWLSSTVVSDACQINDFDHTISRKGTKFDVSDACQINDFDHGHGARAV